MRRILLLLGIVAILVGLLWIGQGTGYVRWPASSFMIGDMHWTIHGAILAVVGLVLVYFGRRRRDLRG